MHIYTYLNAILLRQQQPQRKCSLRVDRALLHVENLLYQAVAEGKKFGYVEDYFAQETFILLLCCLAQVPQSNFKLRLVGVWNGQRELLLPCLQRYCK
jgi:hypothetical protein